jgi:hypothetical protein
MIALDPGADHRRSKCGKCCGYGGAEQDDRHEDLHEGHASIVVPVTVLWFGERLWVVHHVLVRSQGTN